jgi:hypothetical protein
MPRNHPHTHTTVIPQLTKAVIRGVKSKRDRTQQQRFNDNYDYSQIGSNNQNYSQISGIDVMTKFIAGNYIASG